MANDQTTYLQDCLDRLRAGQSAARQELLAAACERLLRLTRVMLRDFQRLKQWEQTDDVFQSAMVRLQRALQDVTPPSLRDFYRLGALQIRRELLDLARHYSAGQAAGQQPARPRGVPDLQASSAPQPEPSCDTFEPKNLAAWSDFHREVDALPEEEREVFDLLWYQGLGHTEAAALLGVSARTVKRRWQSACLQIYKVLGDAIPGLS
jgi:RNA polymerase sigma-70 factor (ECF subfamily)